MKYLVNTCSTNGFVFIKPCLLIASDTDINAVLNTKLNFIKHSAFGQSPNRSTKLLSNLQKTQTDKENISMKMAAMRYMTIQHSNKNSAS